MLELPHVARLGFPQYEVSDPMTSHSSPDSHRQDGPDALCVLTTLSSELEATAIATNLDARNINVRVVGGFLSEFKAETPAGIQLIVARADLDRARAVLAELQSDSSEVDWSDVDVGEPDASDEAN